MSYDILQHASSAQVHNDPYAHIVIDNALPAEVYERLASSFPDPENLNNKLKQNSNRRYDLMSRWGATEFGFASASAQWKAFVETNESTQMARDVLALFPGYTRSGADGEQIDLSRFGADLPEKLGCEGLLPVASIKPRVTLAVNTPVTEMSAVRGPHCDNFRKAYVGLLYFRLPEDDSDGGNLDIYQWRRGAPTGRWPTVVAGDLVEKVRTVTYRANRLVLFPTTDRAIHGVSPRSITPHWRRLVVISGWFPGVDYYDTATMHGRLAGVRSRVISLGRRLLGRQKLTRD